MTDQCDESKCLSTGLMPTGTDPLMFNCYAQGPGTLYPYICADNYVGIEVANDDVATTADPKLKYYTCLLYTSPSPRDLARSRMPSSA